jgi:hypothetical protein
LVFYSLLIGKIHNIGLVSLYGVKYSSNSKDLQIHRYRIKFNPQILGHFARQSLSVTFCAGLIDIVDPLKGKKINFRRLSRSWIDRCNRKKHVTVAEEARALVWT